MARERIVGERASARSDVFSLAVVFDEMLSGQHPFLPSGPGRIAAMAVLKRISEGDYVPLNLRAPEVPTALAQFVARAMSRLPADRPESMAAFGEELERAMKTSGPAPAKAAATMKMDARELVAARARPRTVDPDATTPFGTYAPAALIASASQAALAPIDPELAERAQLLTAPTPPRPQLPSFACELGTPLAIPSLVLVEAPGAWRFMRVPLVARANAGTPGPPIAWLGEGTDVPIPRLASLSVGLLSASAAVVHGLPQSSGARTVNAYETFTCGAYRFQLVPPTPAGLGIPVDYAARTVEQSAQLNVPSLLVRARPVEALMRRFPLSEGEVLIGGLAGLGVPLFGCSVPVAAKLTMGTGSEILVARCADAEVRLQGRRADLLGRGEVLEVEGWEFEVKMSGRGSWPE